jgi:hypothetical protein
MALMKPYWHVDYVHLAVTALHVAPRTQIA